MNNRPANQQVGYDKRAEVPEVTPERTPGIEHVAPGARATPTLKKAGMSVATW